MFKKLLLVASILATGNAQAALSSGDIAFTAFNADEDGLSFATFVDIAANTTIYFTDNEWTGSAFNAGESYNQWNSGVSDIAAGSVIRFSAYDKTTLSASMGILSRATVASNTNWGISNSNETVYAFLGSNASTPLTFLAAITNGTFTADGSLVGTGLTEGVNATRLTAKSGASTEPDYAEYAGDRASLTSMTAYSTLVNNVDNWNVDSVANSSSAALVPNLNNFSVAAVPEPETYAMLIAGLGLVGFSSRKKV